MRACGVQLIYQQRGGRDGGGNYECATGAYDPIQVGYTEFAWCGSHGVRGGVYSNLVYYNKTLYGCGGTGTVLTRA
ncbi:MAG: hypothetical protein N2595_10780 [bacterium]|nr:hypothetical protein [bacterium]